VTTAAQVHDYFSKEKPERGTNLSLALSHAFDVSFEKNFAVFVVLKNDFFQTHFAKRAGKPDTWLIVTDGAPDRPTHVWEILKVASTCFFSVWVLTKK
jgi:hypothetical protein